MLAELKAMLALWNNVAIVSSFYAATGKVFELISGRAGPK